jgi:hypothetical protein
MGPDTLETARSRYAAAYEAYQRAAKCVSERLASGSLPSVADVENEAKATTVLALARRDLLDVMAALVRH